jgi:hypothetical protein
MKLRERLTNELEKRTGLTVAPMEKLSVLEATAEQFRQFRDEASELAYWTLDYFGGRPQEMQPERRKRLAQRSRIAFLHDPLAGAEAELRANFAFAGGVNPPQAKDERVQAIIDRAWNDPNNQELFTGYSAHRRASNSLLTQGELMDLLYVRGGKIRVGKLDPDMVPNIVPDPEHRLRPIYYIGYRRRFKWNVELDQPAFDLETEEGRPKVTYYPHWRNLKDAEREREGEFGKTLEPLPVVPKDKQDPGGGVVYHTAINVLDEQLRGNPPWARTIRFYSAMNEFTEARVSMAQAASTFIARRTMMGSSQTEMVRSAGAVLSQTGELGTSRFSEGGSLDPELGTSQVPGGPFAHTAAPGSWWVENDRSKLESLSLNSGAAAAGQDASIIRAPLAAASGFGQHYLGDASNANLATATSLELPALMAVLSWQKVFEDRAKWFVDRAIEAAVQAGELGGVLDDQSVMETWSQEKLTNLVLTEGSADKAEMEKRTKVDLSYSFSMPYPGRRNLPDVTTSVTSVLGVGDGILVENEAFMEQSLLFLFTHGWQVDDPQDAVEQVMESYKGQIDERKKIAAEIAATGAPGGVGKTAPTLNPPAGPSSVGNSPPGARAPKNEMGATREAWLPEELRAPVAAHAEKTSDLFAQLVELPAIIAAKSLGPSRNGSGEHVAA